MLASPSWLAWSEDLRVSGHWTCAQSAFRKENKWTYSIWPWQHHKHYFYKATLLCIAQDAADCYRWNATVCVLFTSTSPAQMAEMIEMSFGMWTLQTTEPCIKWVPSSPPPWEGALWGRHTWARSGLPTIYSLTGQAMWLLANTEVASVLIFTHTMLY